MKIDIQSPHVEVTENLRSLIQKKVGKLDQYYNYIYDTVVFLRDISESSKEVEIKLMVKNHTLFCSEKDESFEKSVDAAVETMKRQIKKYKEKVQEK